MTLSTFINPLQRALVFLASALLLVQPLVSLETPVTSKTRQKFVVHHSIRPVAQAGRVGLDKCKTCIEFAGQALNQLLNIILRKHRNMFLLLVHAYIYYYSIVLSTALTQVGVNKKRTKSFHSPSLSALNIEFDPLVHFSSKTLQFLIWPRKNVVTIQHIGLL